MLLRYGNLCLRHKHNTAVVSFQKVIQKPMLLRVAEEKHSLGPTGLLFGGFGPGHVANLLLWPGDAELRGRAGGFRGCSQCAMPVLHTLWQSEGFGAQHSPTGHTAVFVGALSLCLAVHSWQGPLPSMQDPLHVFPMYVGMWYFCPCLVLVTI